MMLHEWRRFVKACELLTILQGVLAKVMFSSGLFKQVSYVLLAFFVCVGCSESKVPGPSANATSNYSSSNNSSYNNSERLAESAVVLQYHHVSSETPPVTSVATEQFIAHLDWLKENGFTVLPLQTVVDTLRAKQRFTHSRVAAITFDDGALSVCEQAWPILKDRQLPFTMFVNTEAIERGFRSQCSWQQLREMSRSSLVTIANHSHSHWNMISEPHVLQDNWLENMIADITTAQQLLKKHIGIAPKLFAYPYGEYNSALAKRLSELGYTSFGQQSGPVSALSDFDALPRFSGSGTHGNLEKLAPKLLSLPFPARFSFSSDNPIPINSQANPPVMTLSFPVMNKLPFANINCFNSWGMPITMDSPKQIEQRIEISVRETKRLAKGRHRYTCTSPSPEPQRFYWYSHQWLIE